MPAYQNLLSAKQNLLALCKPTPHFCRAWGQEYKQRPTYPISAYGQGIHQTHLLLNKIGLFTTTKYVCFPQTQKPDTKAMFQDNLETRRLEKADSWCQLFLSFSQTWLHPASPEALYAFINISAYKGKVSIFTTQTAQPRGSVGPTSSLQLAPQETYWTWYTDRTLWGPRLQRRVVKQEHISGA